MGDNRDNNRRIARNTISLYIRNLVNLLVGLFSVRVVLNTLGETDYGIYTVVGGLLGFLTFVSGALLTGSQRFFSYEIGRGDLRSLKLTFKVTLTIYLLLTAAIVILGELFGVWFVNTKLNIDAERLYAANIIFQFVIISTVFSLISTPFTTAIMAHEDMHIFGKIAFLEAGLKLGICILLYISPWDKLITYSFLLLATSFFIQIIYIRFAHRKYDECRLSTAWDNKRIKKMISFSGWNLFGSLAWATKNQGASIILNIFFGPIVNAAHGVATTIRNVSGTFSINFSSALAPQIVKKYAVGDYGSLASLLQKGCRGTYCLMLIIVVPFIFCIDDILHLWLGTHTAYMATFCQIMLLETLIDSISIPLASVNQATGKIALYQASIGFFGLLTLPIAYIFLHNGYSPEWVLIVSAVLQIFVVGVRVVFLRRIFPGAVKDTLRNIILPCIEVSIVSFLICFIVKICFGNMIAGILSILLYFLICIISIWLVAINRNEKSIIIAFAKEKIKSIRKSA